MVHVTAVVNMIMEHHALRSRKRHPRLRAQSATLWDVLLAMLSAPRWNVLLAKLSALLSAPLWEVLCATAKMDSGRVDNGAIVHTQAQWCHRAHSCAAVLQSTCEQLHRL